MAVKTNFSTVHFNRILSDYNIGEFVSSKNFMAGYVQTNILINTTKGKFVLRYYENRSKESVLFETDFLNHLVKHQYPCAKPIINSNGGFIGIFKKKPFVIFSYLEGHHLKSLNNAQIQEMIKHLALLHKLSENYKPINVKHREPRSIEFCLKTAKIESKRFKDKKIGKERLKFVKTSLGKIDFPKNLPIGITHGDFDKANLKFKGDTLSGILDFDDATQTFLIYDLGVILLYWTRFYTKKFDFIKAKRILKIYTKYRPLSKLEHEHIFDAVQFAALMIMSWLLHDKWKGKDLFKILGNIVEEMNNIGRNEFKKRIF